MSMGVAKTSAFDLWLAFHVDVRVTLVRDQDALRLLSGPAGAAVVQAPYIALLLWELARSTRQNDYDPAELFEDAGDLTPEQVFLWAHNAIAVGRDVPMGLGGWSAWVRSLPRADWPHADGVVSECTPGFSAWLRTARFSLPFFRNTGAEHLSRIGRDLLQHQESLEPEMFEALRTDQEWEGWYQEWENAALQRTLEEVHEIDDLPF